MKLGMKCPKCGGTGQVLDPKIVGPEMRELRQKAKLTATDIAERLNFTVPYILDLESGRRGWSKDLQAAYVEAVKLNGK